MLRKDAIEQWAGKQQMCVTSSMLGSPHGGIISLNICKKRYCIIQYLGENNGQEIRAGS
jgi:hypothetical protein